MAHHPPGYWALLTLLGIAIGCLGTLIGAGGGFILMPILVLLYPDERPELLASISLAVVFCNAASGSIGYAIQQKIDYRAGSLFSAAAIPGAVAGAIATGYLPRRAFDLILGMVLIAVGAFLALSRPRRRENHEGAATAAVGPIETAEMAAIPEAERKPPERRSPHMAYERERGAAISFGVGFLSSLLGIGGGIIHVPALVLLLEFPVHVATATSHFVLAVTAAAGTAVHVGTGTFHQGFRRTAALGIGVVIGAQIGARLARRVHGPFILRALAMALVLVGVRIAYAAITARAVHP